jgi:cysteine desulfurase
MRAIYLDHHATTPVDPRVVEVMVPCFTENFGNAASRNHPFGWAAREAVEHARAQVAGLIGAHPKDIIFTSGATESNNLAIAGIVDAARSRGDHIITCVTEHRSVLDTCRHLEEKGARVTYVPVSPDGRVDVEAVRGAVTDRTVLVSVMTANNEIGVVQPVEAIGAIAREKGVPFHTDAVQAAGKIPFQVNAVNADLVSLSAHKMYGPKGVGALFVRRKNPGVAIAEQIHGGGHERGLRSGTLNVPGIVGFGAAAALCQAEMASEASRTRELRDRLLEGLRRNIDAVFVNGSLEHRLPNNLNVSFSGLEGEALLMAIDDIAVSSGSACTSASREPSYVLQALGVPDDLARSSIRFGLGRFTTDAEINHVTDKISSIVRRLREMSPLAQSVDEEPWTPLERLN